MPATGPYQYSLHPSILLFQVCFYAIRTIPDILAAYMTLQKILLQTSLQTFVFEEMATERHKKHFQCGDNVTLKSKNKTKCETNISQLRINQKYTSANNEKVSYFNTPNYSS
jgi:hypothetical protein